MALFAVEGVAEAIAGKVWCWCERGPIVPVDECSDAVAAAFNG